MKLSIFFFLGHDTNLTIYDPKIDEFTIVEMERIISELGIKHQKHFMMINHMHAIDVNDLLLTALKYAGYDNREFQYYGNLRAKFRAIHMNFRTGEKYIPKKPIEASYLEPITIKDIFKTPPTHDQYVEPEDIADHHHAHVFCAYGQSGMDKAWAMSYDGGGDDTCFRVTKVNSVNDYTHKNYIYDLNALYNHVTQPFMKRIKVRNTHAIDVAGKVMGMSGFAGTKVYKRLMRILPILTQTDPEETFLQNQRSVNLGHLPYSDDKVKKIKWPFSYYYLRNTGISHLERPVNCTDDNDISQRDIDNENVLANTVQMYLEKFLVNFIQSNLEDIEKYDNNVILTGGTSLNVIANQKLRKTFPQLKFFVPSNPHDGGLSFGALWEFLAKRDIIKRNDYKITYNGTKILDRDNLGQIKQKYIEHHKVGSLDEVSKLLKDGKILGFVNGKCETGPRALGNRSILADASYPNIKDLINKKVKRREPYRPFAPACLLENAPIYFDSPTFENMEAMQYVVDVKPEYRDKLPAITHVDGTARLQVVEEKNNKVFYDLLKSHGGVLLNTSFNLAGKPILNTYADAVHMWRNTDMDGLVIVDDEGEINIFL